MDGAGNLVIADFYNNRVRVIAATTGTFYGQAMTAGDIYTVAGTGNRGFSGDGGPATAANLGFPSSVAVDRSGNLVISLPYTGRVRVVAVKSGTFYDQAMTAGDIYTVAGNGLIFESGNTGKARDAERSRPARSRWTLGQRRRQLRAVRLRPGAAGRGECGNVLRPAHVGRRIYGIAGNGRPGYTGDGGPAAAARVGTAPGGVAFDGSGNLLVADTINNRIRVIAASSGTFYGQAMTLAHIYTVAGNGTAGFGGDGGPATAAELNGPEGVTVDPAGNLVIADSGNNRIRVVAEKSGTFYGIAMTAGHIYTVAGDGSYGFSGDGGPATAAMLESRLGGGRRGGEPGDRRLREQPDPRRGRRVGHLLPPGDDRRGHLHRGRQRHRRLRRGRRPGHRGRTERPAGGGGRRHREPAHLRHQQPAGAAGRGRPGTYYGKAVTGGDIVTVAGNGKPGFLGDNGLATSAELAARRRPRWTARGTCSSSTPATAGCARSAASPPPGQPATANASLRAGRARAARPGRAGTARR